MWIGIESGERYDFFDGTNQLNYFFYLSYLVINLALIRLHEKAKNKQIKLGLFVAVFLCICLFGILRYDVGNDYANYVRMFERIVSEPDAKIINYGLFSAVSQLFSFSKNGFIGVFGVYFVFTMSVFLYVFKKKNILFWGFFTFVTFGLLFDAFDRVRQMAALAMFILAVDDIVKQNFKQFLLKLLVGAVFHYSVIVLLPVYFVARVRVNVIVYSLVFCVFLVGYYLNIWVKTYEYLYSLIPYYRDIYAGTKYSTQARELATGLGFLGTVLFIYMNILLAPVHRVYKNLLSMGLVIYIFGMGNLNITRIGDYLLAVSVITFPFFVSGHKKIINKLFIVTPMALFLILLFSKDVLSGTYFEYKTIFSENFKNSYLEYREYKNEM